jgi:two-component system NtrC family sensor kinase
MKKTYIALLLLFATLAANAQHKKTDSLYEAVSNAPSDTIKFNALIDISRYYYLSIPDSAIVFGQQAYELADKHDWKKGVARSLNVIANAYATIGDYVKGMQFYLKSLRAYESMHDQAGMSSENNNIGATDIEKGENKAALPYLRLAKKEIEYYGLSHKPSLPDRHLMAIILQNIGEDFLNLQQIDSAEYYLKICDIDSKKDNLTDIAGITQRDLGEVQEARGNKDVALKYFRNAAVLCIADDDVENLSIAYLSTAKLYHKYKLQDSAEYYAKKAFETAAAGQFEQDVLNAGQVLYGYYDEDNNLPQAYKYFKLTTAARDSLYSQDRVKQLLSIDFDEKQRQEDIKDAQLQYQDKVRTYVFMAGLAILLLIVVIFWRNARQRKLANKLLQKQKQEIELALSKLQLTQSQLIQSEKMASLGELTAGIAHEIQNPLNFVNNFSEVNSEMIDELKEELKMGHIEEALGLADEIRQNEDKVSHHGKRADAIVKGMLQHSRASSDVKEPTDINKLADEYLRLAYHGLRAKDKSFNAELETHFSKKLPQVNMVPQDVGRVLLNLFTNAFYATQQRQKQGMPDYKPTVTVSTATQNNEVIVTVKDNGCGIPDTVKDKIMQPFFTTKPTGQGTGLGLSLSYDIIVKGHGGKIDVKSEEGGYTEFIIAIPV